MTNNVNNIKNQQSLPNIIDNTIKPATNIPIIPTYRYDYNNFKDDTSEKFNELYNKNRQFNWITLR